MTDENTRGKAARALMSATTMVVENVENGQFNELLLVLFIHVLTYDSHRDKQKSK